MHCPYCHANDIAVEGIRDDLHFQCAECGYYWQPENIVESIYSYEFVFADGHNFDIQNLSREEVAERVEELEQAEQPIIAVIEHEIPLYDWPDEVQGFLPGIED